MKLLVIAGFRVENEDVKFGAVEYYRAIKPNTVLKRKFDFDFTVINALTEEVTDELIKEHDLVLFIRTLGDDPNYSAERLNKLGIKFGLDLDDYWHLPKNHILYDHYQQNKITENIIESIKLSHFVITTTPILAKEIEEYNRNVTIIENGIDTEDDTWKLNRVESDKIRFGLTLGSTHFYDLGLIAESVQRSFKDPIFYNKAELVMGFHAERHKPSMYVGYERLLTNDLKLIVDGKYRNELKLMYKGSNDGQCYKRFEFKDVFEFGNVYDSIDISIAPLEDNKFNSCKSELKMIESGFKGSAVMVSNVNPYKMIANKENSFLLSENSFYLWQRMILNNPNMVKDKAAQLSEDVKKYDLNLLSDKRYELYKQNI